MESVWENSAEKKTFGSFEGKVSTDVLIIGGGLAGLLCAYRLQRAGVDYVLVEAETICSGITKNTTAKITSQHGLIYDKLIRRFGIDIAREYLYANEHAKDEYRELCAEIDCSYEEKDAYVYSVNNADVIERELIAMAKLSYAAQYVSELPIPVRIAGAIRFPNQAQFNPLRFAYAIATDLRIYEHTTVRELVGSVAVTDRGAITANKIIVATHFPFINKHGSYFLKLYQHRSYVIALSDAPNVGGMYLDECDTGLSFRNYDGLLLLGGGGHRTGKKGGCWQELRDFARTNYPNAKEQFAWATQDCITLDDVPYIGRYSAMTNDLYVATGFNKWGMTSAMLASMLLCDMVQGKHNRLETVFSPSRSIIYPQLAANAWEATVSLLTPTNKRCPHLGCALKWNRAEHTWDCPCHGSRFSENGGLIDNPATKKLRK